MSRAPGLGAVPRYNSVLCWLVWFVALWRRWRFLSIATSLFRESPDIVRVWKSRNSVVRPRHFNRAVKSIMDQNHGANKCWQCQIEGMPQGRPIKAHTVQVNGSLRQICDETRHVGTFFQWYLSRGPDPSRRVGIRQASTFQGLCDQHDNALFRSIDTGPFVGSPDQLWAIFYRSVVWESHAKELTVRRFRDLMKLFRETGRNTGENWENLSAILAGMLQGLKDGTQYLT